jgi:splicing suppressor protein 51
MLVILTGANRFDSHPQASIRMAETRTTSSKQDSCCFTCKKTDVKLKRCAKCSKTKYCSRDCQKANWKAHKKVCTQDAGTSPAVSRPIAPAAGLPVGIARSIANKQAPVPGPGIFIDKPFTRLHNRTWLHARPRKEVYKLLIDAYRLRMEENYSLEGEAETDSIYGGAADGLEGFRRFLAEARSRLGFLPQWWDGERQRECEALGMTGTGWSDLSTAVGMGDINEHYGDPRFAMQLRIVGETVYGTGPGGQPDPELIEHMMAMESTSGTFSMLNLDAKAVGIR